MTRSIKILSLLLGALILSACGPKITGLKQDPSFTYAAIQSDGIAIGGVVSRIKPLTEKEVNRNALNLLYAMQEERADYPTKPMATIRETLGADTYNLVTKEYADNGILSTTTLNTIRSKAIPRFLVFISIDQDSTTEPRWQQIAAKRDKDGNIISGESMQVSMNRSVSVAGTVIDLKQGMEVWSGKLSTSKNATASYKKDQKTKLQKDIETVAAIADLVQGKAPKSGPTMQQLYPAPNPPELHIMLEHIYEGFADALPEKD